MEKDGYGWLEGLKLARQLRAAGPAQRVVRENQANWRLPEISSASSAVVACKTWKPSWDKILCSMRSWAGSSSTHRTTGLLAWIDGMAGRNKRHRHQW